jgi:ABC-type branched-subunit amino acid transport system substrate-binding protein
VAGLEALAAGDPRRVGRYQVLARLGGGAMGRVFLARSPGGRPVAVKVVRAELAEDGEFRRRFAREVAAARRVSGVFTAAVVDADPEGAEGAPPWLATAYVTGPSLAEAVAAHGPWPEGPVRALGAGLAEALEAIHAAGVVHRDLKPSNVLLAPDGPRVIDFGISLAAEETALTEAGAMVGTPGYMAPEQLRGGSAGPASDVFALGAVLVYATTGRGPFGSGLAAEVNFRAAYEPAELGAVPPGLLEVVARCLEKDAERRPGVGELLERLGEGAGAERTDAGWLPAPVARDVRERSETPLPATPPSPSPSPPPPPPRPLAGPPPAPPAPPAPPTGQGTSRRRVLAVGSGAAAVAGLGALGYALTTGGGSGGEEPGDGRPGGETEPTTVRIAVHAPLTGDIEAFGQDILAAVRLAVDEENASGNHPDVRFEVVEADDQGGADQAATAARTVIDDPTVVAVVGPALSEAAHEAAPLYGDAGLAAVTPSATDPALTQQGYPTLLRAVPNDRHLARAIGELLAAEDFLLDVTVVDDGTPYALDSSDAIAEPVAEVWTMTLTTTSTEDSDIAGIAGGIVSDAPDAVACTGFHDAAVSLSLELDAQGYNGYRIGGDGMLDPMRFVAGASVHDFEGWFLVCSCAGVASGGRSARFAENFRQAHDLEPGWSAPRAYDVTRMIIETVISLGENADRGTVYEALAATSHDGVSGTTGFGPGGEYAGTAPVLFRARDGAMVRIGPADPAQVSLGDS